MIEYNDKLYKTIRSTGAAGITLGVLIIVGGVTLGILNIVFGARLLKNKRYLVD